MAIVHLINHKADRQAAIVDLLRGYLERAEKGEIDGVAVVAIVAEQPDTNYQFASWLQAEGATAHLHHEVLKLASE